MGNRKEYFKQYWKKNREEINRKHREFYKKTNGIWHREYLQKNKDKILAYKKQFYENNRERLGFEKREDFWQLKDEQILKKWYGKITAQEIQKKFLSNRTCQGIVDKARKIGLKSNRSLLLKGKNNPFWNKHHKTGTKLKISLKNKGRLVGEKNPAYKDGKGNEPYPMGWTSFREPIRQRDNYRCQICGIHQKKLQFALCVHHIDRDEKNLDPMNLISLCLYNHGNIQFFQDDLKDYFYAINLGELPRK